MQKYYRYQFGNAEGLNSFASASGWYQKSVKGAMKNAARDADPGAVVTVYEITVKPVKKVKFKTVVENVSLTKKAKKKRA